MYYDKQMVVTPDWTRLMIRLMSAKFHIHAYIFFHMNNYILTFLKPSKTASKCDLLELIAFKCEICFLSILNSPHEMADCLRCSL